MPPMSERENRMKNKIWGTVLVLSLAVIVVSGVRIFMLSKEYREGINVYKGLEQYATVEESKEMPAKEVPQEVETQEDGTVVETVKSQIPVTMHLNYASLKMINEDFKGWLLYEPLALSYPIVRGDDNDFYAYHTFEKEKNNSGAIFMDFLNKPDYTDYNTIIYGHNMRNGTMFGSLKKLLSDTGIVEENPYFYIFTEDQAYMYEIFAVYITRADSATYDLVDTPEAQEEYLSYIDKTATWKSDKKVTGDDKVVTLSTCHGLHSNNRTVVHGVLIAQEDR